MTTRQLITFLLIATSPLAHADRIFGIYAGANHWQQNYDGFVRDMNSVPSTEIDFEDDLGLNDDSGNVFYVAIEHLVPVLPNIKLQHSEVEIDGNNVLSKTINFDDQTFTVSDTVRTESDLSHTDLTMYYQILDNWVSIDLGLTVRQIDGSVRIQTSNIVAEEDFDAPIPMIYAATRFDLPFTGGYAGVSINAIGYSDTSFIDYQAVLGYESDWGIGAEVGYRCMDLELDDIDDIEAEITVDGAYAGLIYHL